MGAPGGSRLPPHILRRGVVTSRAVSALCLREGAPLANQGSGAAGARRETATEAAGASPPCSRSLRAEAVKPRWSPACPNVDGLARDSGSLRRDAAQMEAPGRGPAGRPWAGRSSALVSREPERNDRPCATRGTVRNGQTDAGTPNCLDHKERAVRRRRLAVSIRERTDPCGYLRGSPQMSSTRSGRRHRARQVGGERLALVRWQGGRAARGGRRREGRTRAWWGRPIRCEPMGETGLPAPGPCDRARVATGGQDTAVAPRRPGDQ